MELGEKLRKARLEAGLSQRQLAGGEITRNMLSLIENGSATPSMKTLQYLAGRLGKPISAFLEDESPVSPNQSRILSARQLYDSGDYGEAVQVLEGYQAPDPLFDREKALLWALIHLELAARALREGREPYALTLLKQVHTEKCYCAPLLERQRLLLLGQVKGQQVSDRLPSLDGELLLRAQEALDAGNTGRAASLLDAAENSASPRWNLLRGQVLLARKQYREAALCFHAAEHALPQAIPLLESCYRELGDYRKAYEYACRQRQRFPF